MIGVGLNVNLKEIQDELKDKATSLYLETGKTYDRNRLIGLVWRNLKSIMRNLSKPAIFPLQVSA